MFNELFYEYMYRINNIWCRADIFTGIWLLHEKLVLEVKLRNVLFYSLSIISLLFIYCVHECLFISRVFLSHYIFISNGTWFVIFFINSKSHIHVTIYLSHSSIIQINDVISIITLYFFFKAWSNIVKSKGFRLFFLLFLNQFA